MPEIESQILYSDLKTRESVEAAAAEVPVVDFTDSNVGILYQDAPNGLGLDAKQISGILGLGVSVVYKDLKRAGIPTKASLFAPLEEEKRIERVRSAFTKRHDKIVAKMQRPEARANRTEGLKNYWSQDTARVRRSKELARHASDHHSLEQQETWARQRKAVEDRKELRRLALRQERIQTASSILDNPNFGQLPTKWQEVLTRRYSPSRLGEKPITHAAVADSMKISRAGAQAIEMRAIRDLDNMGVPLKPGQIRPDEFSSIRPNSVERKILDVLSTSEGVVSLKKLAEKTGSRTPNAVYKGIPKLRAHLMGSGLKIVRLYNRGYRIVAVPQQQLEG